MLYLSVSKEEPVLTEEALGLLSIDSDDNITNIVLVSSLFIGESEALEANAIAVGDRVRV